MVCARCKIIVRLELEKLEIHFNTIELNEIETTENVSQEKLKQLDNNLRPMGLELTENRKDVLAEKIRTAIIELINSSDGQEKTNLSDYLSGKLNHRYTYLANVFSAVKGTLSIITPYRLKKSPENEPWRRELNGKNINI